MAQLSGSARYSQYTATANQTTFVYSFEINTDAEIKVQKNDTTLTLTTHYTVTGAGESTGGTVVLVTGAALNDIITITGNTLIKRTTTFVEGGDYLASAINAEYDALDAIVSELLTQQAQTFKFDPIIPAFTATIPTPVATKTIRVNAAGTGFEMSTYDPDGQVTLAAAQVVLCEAETAKCLAETAKCEAETAKCIAETAKCVAQTALATGFAGDASTSATDAAASAASINPAAFGSDLIPDADGTRDLGSSAKEWAEVHTTDAFIYNDATVTGDVTAATFNGAALYTGYDEAYFANYFADNTTDGGSAASTNAVRPLNTTIYNNITGCSLSSNQITLPIGSYEIDIQLIAYDTGQTRAGLRKVGDGNVLHFWGPEVELPATENTLVSSFCHYVVAVETDIEIIQYSSTAQLTDGFGHATGNGSNTATYTKVKIRKYA